jgi:pentatricopeptide repeat protein
MISDELSPNTATFNTVIAALAEGHPDSKIGSNILWEKALAVFKVMKSKHAPPGVTPNRQTYSVLIRCLDSNLQPGYAESLLNAMRRDGFVPDVDLYTLTVRSYERCGNPMKALRLMESMREVGYHFYEVKMLDDAFKNGVKILNQVGRGFTSPSPTHEPLFSIDIDGIDHFGEDNDEYEDEYDYQLLDALKKY